MKKPQFNVRIRGNLKDAIKQVCVRLDWSEQEIGEVALMSLFGSRDGLIREKRKKIQEAAREMSLSFRPADPQPDSLAA